MLIKSKAFFIICSLVPKVLLLLTFETATRRKTVESQTDAIKMAAFHSIDATY